MPDSFTHLRIIMPDTAANVATTLPALMRLRTQARGFSFLPRQPIRSLLSGKHASRIRGRGLDFEELRNYRIGDDVRTIDWKVTNRTGKPYVRVYTEERDRPCFVVVDQRNSMFFGSRLKMKSVTAAEVAAWRVLGVSDRIGGLVFNDRDSASTRPERSERTVMQWLGQVQRFNAALVSAPPLGGDRPALSFGQVLQQTEKLCPHDYLIVLISDFSGWTPDAAMRLRRLTRHNDLIAVHISDPLEQQLPAGRSFVVSDGESQLEVDANQLGEKFATSFDESVASIETELQHYGVPVIPIHTADEVAPQIRHAIGKLGGHR